MNILSLFDGMSCGQIALERASIKVDNYFASEIDKYAIKVTQSNYPNTIQIGDATTIQGQHSKNKLGFKFIDNKIDLLLGGSPCQGFSFAGNKMNFNDSRSKLFFEFVRLLKETKPKYFLLENVGMKKEYQNIISKFLNTEPIEINSSLLSAQNRKRLYWTNIIFPKIQDKKIMLKDIIGEYNGIYVYPRGYNKGGLQHYKGKAPCITTSAWQHNFFIVQKKIYRKFTVNEVEQLQTVPIDYIKGISNNRRYKMLGNGWTVDVVAHIFKGIKND